RGQVLLGRVAPVVVGRADLADAEPIVDDRPRAREPPGTASLVVGDGGDQLRGGLDRGGPAVQGAHDRGVALIERIEVLKAVAGSNVPAAAFDPVDPVEDRPDLDLVGRTEGVTE